MSRTPRVALGTRENHTAAKNRARELKLLPILDYEALLERAEDAADVASFERTRRKPLHYRHRPLADCLAARDRK